MFDSNGARDGSYFLVLCCYGSFPLLSLDTGEFSLIMFGYMQQLGRRSALFSHRTPPAVSDEPKALEVQWAEWIEAESSRRIAHVTFWLDTERKQIFSTKAVP